MPDAVTTNVIFKGTRKLTYHLTNVSDGSGETAVAKVDLSALLPINGVPPTSVTILAVTWTMVGFTKITFFWDHTTDDLAFTLVAPGGFMDFTQQGAGLADPESAGGTGDLLLTTAGAVSGAAYDITLEMLLKS